MTKPPPTPMIAAMKPTKAPIIAGGMTLMYSFERWKRILNGRPCTQLCWPVLRTVPGWPTRVRRSVLMLSISISAPTAPRKVT